MLGLPWWLVTALLGGLLLLVSMPVPFVGLWLWERLVERPRPSGRKVLDDF